MDDPSIGEAIARVEQGTQQINQGSHNHAVSVVIPAYNAERTIVETLESVRLQTYRPFEIIIVNDGSTDNTAKMIRDYDRLHLKEGEEQNPIDLRYIYQRNGGPSKARNAGIKASRGQYIAFLDADDLWTHDKLAKQMKIFFQESSVDIVFTDVRITRVRNGQVEEFTIFQKKKLDIDFFGHDVMVINALEKLMKMNFMPTPAVMVRRACFDNERYFNEKRLYVEDWELWLKMALHFNFAYVSDVCVHVRDEGDGLCAQSDNMMLSALKVREDFVRENMPRLSRSISAGKLTMQLKKHYLWAGHYFIVQRKKISARNFYKKSLRMGIDCKSLFYYFKTFLPI